MKGFPHPRFQGNDKLAAFLMGTTCSSFFLKNFLHIINNSHVLFVSIITVSRTSAMSSGMLEIGYPPKYLDRAVLPSC